MGIEQARYERHIQNALIGLSQTHGFNARAVLAKMGRNSMVYYALEIMTDEQINLLSEKLIMTDMARYKDACECGFTTRMYDAWRAPAFSPVTAVQQIRLMFNTSLKESYDYYKKVVSK